MGNIQLVDRVQTNMKAARDALGEAAGMAQLLATVESTFQRGDLKTIGRQLKQIREGLESVRGVPEFSGVETKLHEFEERLQTMVQTPLQKAFEDHDAEAVKHLSSILLLSKRSDVIGTLFVSAHIFKLQSSWESFSPIQPRVAAESAGDTDAPAKDVLMFEDFLPEWLRKVLSIVESEYKWCLENLPEQADFLLVNIIETCFISVKQSFKNRLQNRLSVAKAVDASPLAVLLKVKKSLEEFMGSAKSLLTRDPPHKDSETFVEGLALCIYGQIKDQVLLYPLLERQEISSFYNKLAGELQNPTAKLRQLTLSSNAAIADAIESCTQAIHGVIHPACKIGEDSLLRCLSTTDGFKIDELLLVADESLAAFLEKAGLSLKAIQESLKDRSLKSSSGMKSVESDMQDQSQQDALPEDILVAILRVLQMAALFLTSISILEANLHSSVSVLKSQWEYKSDGIHVWFKLFPGQREVHEGKLEGFQAGGVSLLPCTDKAARDFNMFAEQLVLDFMMIKVKESLLGIEESKLWSRIENKDKTFDLPSFSVFPSKHVTSLGEYLLIVPQQFEVLDNFDELNSSRSKIKEGDEEEGDTKEDQVQEQNSFAAEWITKIVEEASRLYTRDILRIPKLSENGCSQLQADVDYFCNILQALFVPVPLNLSTIASNLSFNSEEVRLSKNQPKNCDVSTWDRIVKMRVEGKGSSNKSSR